MLTVHHSNRLEVLADRLADTIGQPAGGLFHPEIVLVQSDKTRRWLSLELARHLGVAANIEFPFPAAYIWKLLGQVVPGIPEQSPFDAGVVTWRLADILSRQVGDVRFKPLRAFLGEEERRRFELARRLAALFGSYLVYRPDWLESWRAGRLLGLGPHEAWEAALWRLLAAGIEDQISEDPAERLFRELREQPASKDRLPRRLSLFGFRDLPPAYWDIFRELSDWLDLHLFVMNPCRLDWLGSDGDAEKTGTLLDAWGGHGMVFLGASGLSSGGGSYEEPGDDTLLHRLQSAILDNRGPAGLSLDPEDISLAVHSCHGPRREMEVLHDQLLAILERDPDPSHIGVLVPDIEAYAPYIEAVFGSSSPRIPYAIADLKGRLASPLLAALLALLDFPTGRFEASRVLAILENPAVSRRFAFEERDLDRIRGWVRETGIRWGLDERSRGELGLPKTGEHTWRAGLDGLLLGYAMLGEGNSLFLGMLPRDVEGDGIVTLGKLARAVDALAALREELAKPRSPASWSAYLQGTVDTFLEPGRGEEGEIDFLRRALRELEQNASMARFDGTVGLEPMRDLIRAALDRPLPSSHLSGTLTFGSLASLASIPFRTVCLVGMNDGVFPSASRPPDFDLMARHQRPGDRVRREEDRYLFLEAILSARERLYISYAGQSERDDTSVPPSVLLTDLLEHLAAGFSDDRRDGFLKRLVLGHPLQPFSRRYFDGRDTRLFSYADDLCRACRQKGRPEERGRFLTGPLPDEQGEADTLELDELVRFYQGPVRHFLQRRLGIRVEEGGEQPEDREPFSLEQFKDGDLRRRLLPALQKGSSTEDLRLLARAGGELPQGAVGRVIEAKQVALARVFGDRILPLLTEEPPPPLPVDVMVAGIRLTGSLDRVKPDGLHNYEASGIWDKDYLGIWIRHLALHLAAPPGFTRETRWEAANRTLTFGPVEKPEEHLKKLVTRYREGMRRPLHLFPRTSLAAARKTREGKDWLKDAQGKWSGNDFSSGEKDAPYHRIAFRDSDIFDDEFETLTGELLLPMLDCLTEKEHG